MNKLVIIGDSQAINFRRMNKVEHFVSSHRNFLEYEVHDISSATIRGLGKNKSTLGLRKRIDKIMIDTNPSTLLFCLGHTDSGVGYFYRTMIQGNDVNCDSDIEETISIYRRYLEILQNKYNVDIVIKGVNPTVLINQKFAASYISNIITKDVQQKDKLLFLKKKITSELPDYKFRLEINRKLNIQLKLMSKELGLKYFDLWEKLIQKGTEMVSLDYLPAFFDHHLADSVEVRKIHYDALYDVLKELVID